ncbi:MULTISPECIES: hypothetical protein [Streptomyces]|uniref:Uncharacterized protein n=1 Tax=Streptomyces lycii TaxID=2654337 RepID=A0ABQ7FD90_9ACTN|nr:MULTISPECIES: hypothetical protein [Streptomyces]KAF4406349.1 hypothetical protein GCU69_25575 [Streptomyces lycii]PGH48026.1 hypothetical protein CRI70_25320 [Streptomyces sp. Ru87]
MTVTYRPNGRAAGGGPAIMAGMDEEERRPRTVRLRAHLEDLRDRLDPASYHLLTKILRGVEAALAAGGGDVEIDLPEAERELFTPQLQRELRTVMGLLDFAEDSVVIDLGESGAGHGQEREHGPEGGPERGREYGPGRGDEGGAGESDAVRRQRAADLREVRSIARASGMSP